MTQLIYKITELFIYHPVLETIIALNLSHSILKMFHLHN